MPTKKIDQMCAEAKAELKLLYGRKASEMFFMFNDIEDLLYDEHLDYMDSIWKQSKKPPVTWRNVPRIAMYLTATMYTQVRTFARDEPKTVPGFYFGPI